MRVEWIAAAEAQNVEVSAAQREISEHPPKLPRRELPRIAHIGRREITLAKLPCRGLDMQIRRLAEPGRLDIWAEPLALASPLPTLPLWLSAGLALPLHLEETYCAACAARRIELP